MAIAKESTLMLDLIPNLTLNSPFYHHVLPCVTVRMQINRVARQGKQGGASGTCQGEHAAVGPDQ